MEQTHPVAKRLHPLMAAAAIGVTLVSLAGAAAIMGLLPSSHSKTDALAAQSLPATPLAPVTQPVAVSAAPPAKPVAEAPAAAPKSTPAIAPQRAHHAATTQAAATKPRPVQHEAPRSEPLQQAAICHSCGRVESVSAIEAAAPPTSGVGVAAGAVLGGLLGNQIGGGHGRTLATVAGAVGGSLAGNEVERRTRAAPTSYQVRVRMEDGSVRSFPYAASPNWNAGDRVHVVNGQLSAQG